MYNKYVPFESSLQQAFQFTHENRVEIKAQGDWMTEGGGGGGALTKMFETTHQILVYCKK